MQVTTAFREPQLWHQRGETIVRGQAFEGDTLLGSEELAGRLSARLTNDEFVEWLDRLNGSFAVVCQAREMVRLAVDHIRSIPIFYAWESDHLYVSDDCHWVAAQIASGSRDPVANMEFLHSGYVMDGKTRCPRVRQCLPGEMVTIHPQGQGLVVASRRYFVYSHLAPFECDQTELAAQHRAAIEASCRRLMQLAAGRQIAIPLSGGHDSRLIVVALRSLGCKHLCAFTYGHPSSFEVAISRQVAEALAIPWHFVEYSDELWASWRRSLDWKRYLTYAGTLAALPHIQDLPAVHTLRAQQRLEPDCIIAPGHSLDMLAGSRSCNRFVSRLYRPAPRHDDLVMAAILRWHFPLWDREDAYVSNLQHIEKRIREMLRRYPAAGEVPNASLFETWDWETRQAGFIVNSARVYDFLGLRWWQPLWDRDICEFWQRAPGRLRFGKRWYRQFVDDWYQEVTGRCPPQRAETLLGKTKKWIAHCPPLADFIVRCGGTRVLRKAQHPLACFGMLTQAERRQLASGVTNINAFLVSEMLANDSAAPTFAHVSNRLLAPRIDAGGVRVSAKMPLAPQGLKKN